MITIKSLSEYTKISSSTISRYLNGGYVSDEKKKIISDAIKKFNYRSDSIAKSLKLNKTNTIALILSCVTNYFFSELAELIQSRLLKLGYKLSLYVTKYETKVERECLNVITSQKADAIITVTGSKSLKKEYENIGRPVISIDRKISDNIYTILPNNKKGVYDLAKLLYDKGARKFVFINNDDENIIVSNERKEGLLAFSKEYQIIYEIVSEKNFFEEKYSLKEIDAIMVWNDQTAFMVANYLLSKGIKIGKEIMITGYDDSVFSKYTAKGITTAHQPIDKIVDEVERVIIQCLKENNEIIPKTILIENPIIERNSTKR